MGRVLSAALGVVLLAACGGAPDSSDATSESAYSKADFAESRLLPYAGAWLDVDAALGGLDQFDRLAATIHDGDRCGAMAAIAAAVVGGEGAFDTLLSHVEARRASDSADTKTLAVIRANFEARKLRTRDLHLFADCVMRAYVPHGFNSGSTDGQEATMIRASGWTSTKQASTKPADLLASLAPGEIVPLSLDVTQDGKGWHWILAWRDASGALALYDSDDQPGPHVHHGGTPDFDARVTNPTASSELRETFHR